MLKYKEVVFVCGDNTSLSVAAEEMYRKTARERGVKKGVVRSRGMTVLFPEPVNTKMEKASRKKGINISEHTSKSLRETDFADSVLCLATTEEYKERIYKNYKNAVNVYTIKEFVGQSGDLESPFGGDDEAYDGACNQLQELVGKIIDKIYGDEKK